MHIEVALVVVNKAMYEIVIEALNDVVIKEARRANTVNER